MIIALLIVLLLLMVACFAYAIWRNSLLSMFIGVALYYTLMIFVVDAA